MSALLFGGWSLVLPVPGYWSGQTSQRTTVADGLPMPGLTAAKLTATVLRDWTAETERPTQEGAPDCRRASNGSVLRGAFQFFATHEGVCGFDLAVAVTALDCRTTDRLSGHSGNPALRRLS